jgi:hypothetical protein
MPRMAGHFPVITWLAPHFSSPKRPLPTLFAPDKVQKDRLISSYSHLDSVADHHRFFKKSFKSCS